MLVSEVSFWDQLLCGNDTIFAPTNVSATIFGDQFSVDHRNVIAGNDTIVGGEVSQTLIADTPLVSGEFNGGATLTGGADILNAISGNAAKTLIGDADYVIEATVFGGRNSISGSAGGDTVIGDVRTLGDSMFSGGDDALYGRAGNDSIVGDIDAIGSGNFQGSDATGGNDLIDGGSDNDVLYGDFRSIYDIVSQTITGGNDQLYGGEGNDIIYGNSAEAPASAVDYAWARQAVGWRGK